MQGDFSIDNWFRFFKKDSLPIYPLLENAYKHHINSISRIEEESDDAHIPNPTEMDCMTDEKIREILSLFFARESTNLFDAAHYLAGEIPPEPNLEDEIPF